jgi:outer membrane immunogenic protein
MKIKLLSTLAVAASLCGTQGAVAADMPIKAPVKAPLAAAVVAHNWSGFYVGGNCGYAWGQTTTQTIDGGDVFYSDLHPNGAMCGGQAGYNWQSAALVFGVEGDIGYLWLKKSPIVVGDDDALDLRTVKYGGYGTITGRIGYSWGQALAYVKGGAAFARISHSGYELPVAGSNAYDVSKTRTGWLVGGGLEYALTQNWSWRVEYLYMDFGDTSNTTTDTSITINHKDKVQAVTLGFNYKFASPIMK